jgi:hypothetical protein
MKKIRRLFFSQYYYYTMYELVVAAVTGGGCRAFMTANPENPNTFDSAMIGTAGGLLGGLVYRYYMPGSGWIGAIFAGLAGMALYDFVLFSGDV